jgi:hypothetical protein
LVNKGTSGACLEGLSSSGGVLNGEISPCFTSSFCGSRVLGAKLPMVGVPGFFDLFTGGGTLTFANGEGKSGSTESVSAMVLGRGRVLDRGDGSAELVTELRVGTSTAERVGERGLGRCEFPNIGFGGDTGDCSVMTGGAGELDRDHIPNDIGLCLGLP